MSRKSKELFKMKSIRICWAPRQANGMEACPFRPRIGPRTWEVTLTRTYIILTRISWFVMASRMLQSQRVIRRPPTLAVTLGMFTTMDGMYLMRLLHQETKRGSIKSKEHFYLTKPQEMLTGLSQEQRVLKKLVTGSKSINTRNLRKSQRKLMKSYEKRKTKSRSSGSNY